ncbi:hypothetical protein [Campylobacter avium]|uniref:hypothetical protein n=1 Tax=Campylobacter avium TaxID=522485 RepID=UPI00255BF6FC|nr:hypothetical protein [Campylobacter avium]
MRTFYLPYKKIVLIFFIMALLLYLYFKPTVKEYDLEGSVGVPTMKEEFVLIVPKQRNFALNEKEYTNLKVLSKNTLTQKELSWFCDKKELCELYHYLKEKDLDKVSFFLYVDRFI